MVGPSKKRAELEVKCVVSQGVVSYSADQMVAQHSMD